MSNIKHNIVTIGGGSGQYSLLSGLRDMDNIDISAVVSMADSGGSTGRLRDELGILPPGDILKCILALSPNREIIRTIFQRRFKGNRRLKGHNAGNMLLTMLSHYAGSFPNGVTALSEILNVRGNILPVTIDRATLVAELTDGTRVYGESAIDMPRGNQREKIRDVFLVPHYGDTMSVYPPVIDAIKKADLILLGPGDLFTSLIPNLIVPGVKKAICEANAPVYFIINIMTKYGETNNYKASEFAARLELCIGRHIEGVIHNSKEPAPKLLKRYRAQKAEYVSIDYNADIWKRCKVHSTNLIETTDNIIRHSPEKLAEFIKNFIN